MNRARFFTTSIILAAGISRRMQTLKAFLPFDETYSFFEKIIKTYSEWGCNEIIVVVNQQFAEKLPKNKNLPPRIKLVMNDHLEYERFYSVKIGLQKMTDADFCFIQNIDNPFITEEILDAIYQGKTQDSFIIPTYQNMGGHPVLINRNIIEHLKSYPDNNGNLRDVLAKFPSTKISMPDDTILININSPEEYEKHFTLIQN